jgi:ABC-type bacteriocin/lantibiotic exporter with double-glycine peptidase domain
MEKLRFKQYKTLEEQKKFLDLKYPKKIKQKMTVNSFIRSLGFLVFLCLLFFAYGTLFALTGIVVPVWLAILFIIVVPIIITMILNKFGLSDNNTLFDLFRRKGK